MEVKNEFKDILKELRKERGIGQVELANQLSVSKGVISLWENGLREPSMTSLISLSKFFGVSSDYLLGLTDKK